MTAAHTLWMRSADLKDKGIIFNWTRKMLRMRCLLRGRLCSNLLLFATMSPGWRTIFFKCNNCHDQRGLMFSKTFWKPFNVSGMKRLNPNSKRQSHGLQIWINWDLFWTNRIDCWTFIAVCFIRVCLMPSTQSGNTLNQDRISVI